MAGPYQPNHGAEPFSGPGSGRPIPYPDNSFTAALPPPLPYPPRRRRGPVIAAVAIALAVLVAVATAVVFGMRDDAHGRPAVLTSESAKQAIQDYLDALSDGDLQAVSRNALCGLYDGVKDRRTDDALARLSSETFRKQFSRAEVLSVDTLVFTSPNSAQALFTMNVAPTAGNRADDRTQRQAVAQLLAHDDELLVCSYVQRTAGAF